MNGSARTGIGRVSYSELSNDEIVEVSKGMNGADCIQLVKNSQGIVYGKIVYESKRTKSFENDWIDKLKSDLIECKEILPC